MLHWTCVVRRKEVKHVSRGLLQKRKDVTEISNNQHATMIVVKDELRKAKDK